MPHNYCYHSKKSKLIYFEFSSHCLVWLASRLEPAREPPPSRAEPDFLARKNSEPSRARLVDLRQWDLTRSPGPLYPEPALGHQINPTTQGGMI